MSEKTTKELVLEGRDEGNVVFLQHGGGYLAVMSTPIDEFIQQPADGILYDLNRLEEIALTYIDDPKWVNDFAVALTIRALKKERDALLAVVKPLVQFDLQGAISWAKVIVEEWKAGEQDWASMKVAEKLLKIAPDLEDTLAALPEHLKEKKHE